MNLRTRGEQLGRLLGCPLPPTLIEQAKTLQCRLLPFAASCAAVLGALMWLIGMPSDIAFAVSLICIGARLSMPLFVEILVGMAARRNVDVAHYFVTLLITTGTAFLAAHAIMLALGGLVPRFYLAAVVTGLCAPALLHAYSMWYCRGGGKHRPAGN